jgi:plasmid stabilization system protein ParE
LSTFGTITLERQDAERRTEFCATSRRPLQLSAIFHLPAARVTKVRSGLRSLAATPQIIFYRLKDDRPEIVRVLDGRRDIEEIFSDGENG